MAENKEKSRSPSYPYYNLKKCVGLVEKFYKQNRLAKANRDLAMKHMGLDPDKAWDFRATSAITGYGLLEENNSDRTFKLSNIGRQLMILSESEDKRKEALRKAALNYKIIKDLADEYPNGLPADDVINLALVNKYGFAERAASRFVSVFRDTYNYAGLAYRAELPLAQEEQGGHEPHDDGGGDDNNGEHGSGVSNPPDGLNDYRIPLDGGKRFAFLYVPSGLSSRDADFIKQHINLLMIQLADENHER